MVPKPLPLKGRLRDRPRRHRYLGIADGVVLGDGDEGRSSSGEECSQRARREAGACRPSSAADDRGQRGREVKHMPRSGVAQV